MKLEWRTRRESLHAKRAKRRGRDGRWGGEEEAVKVEPGNTRDVVFEQTRDTRVSPPLPSVLYVSLHRGTPPLCLCFPPLLRLSTLPILSVSFLPLFSLLFSLYRFTMVDSPLRRLPPSPPDPSSWAEDWSAIHFRVARDSTRQKSHSLLPFFLSIFSSLSLSVLCSPLLSIHLSALLSALAFVDRVILAPGRRQNQGKMGKWREEGRAIFGFLGTGNGNGEGGSKGGVEWRVECSFLFLLPNRDGFYVICPIAIARRREQMCEIEWVKQRRVG